MATKMADNMLKIDPNLVFVWCLLQASILNGGAMVFIFSQHQVQIEDWHKLSDAQHLLRVSMLNHRFIVYFFEIFL